MVVTFQTTPTRGTSRPEQKEATTTTTISPKTSWRKKPSAQGRTNNSIFFSNYHGEEYSLSLFNHFCPVKQNSEYFAAKWSEQKVLIIEVVGLYSTYQKYKRIGVPSSYQFGENWT